MTLSKETLLKQTVDDPAVHNALLALETPNYCPCIYSQHLVDKKSISPPPKVILEALVDIDLYLEGFQAMLKKSSDVALYIDNFIRGWDR